MEILFSTAEESLFRSMFVFTLVYNLAFVIASTILYV